MGFKRAALLWATLVVAAFCAGAAPTAAQPANPQWAHVGADLAPDPSINFGVLPNGMRYAIQKNTSPAGQTAMRLLINSGSMQEAPDQYGLAHFLEHMAFRGSTRFADGEAVNTLTQLGLTRGAGINARTGPAQTVFMYNFPRSDDASIDAGLTLMRETASELKLDPATMQTEANVVLSEERLRDTPQARALREQTRFFYGEHPYFRPAIGQNDIVSAASSTRMRAYYEAYYRPERATLVVVGDFDWKVIEAKIRAKFSDWRGKGEAGGDPKPAVYAPRPSDLKTGIMPGITMLTIYWPKPYRLRPETRAEAIRSQINNIAGNIIGRRLAQQRAAANPPPFLTSIMAGARIRNVAEGTQMSLAQATDWRAALSVALRTQKQAVQYGVSQQEVDLVVTTMRANMTATVNGAATRDSTTLSEQIVNASANDQVLISPAQRLELFEQAVKNLKAAQIDAELRDMFSSEPIAYYLAPTIPAEGEGAMRAAFIAAVKAPVLPYSAPDIKPWPYTSFGVAGKVAERRTDEPNLTMIRFENGVRLTIKPSDVQKNIVSVNVRFGHGKLDWPRDRINASQLVDSVFIGGGLKDLSADEIRRTLDGKLVRSGFSTGDSSFQLTGASTPGDLELQMQVLAAYLTAPGWRSDSLPQTLTAITQSIASIDTDAGRLASSRATELMHAGDARWRFTTKEDIANATMSDVRAFLEPVLSNAPVEVIVVGDVTVDRAIETVAATFGAIPPRAALAEPAGARIVSFPAPTPKPIEAYHKGRADQGVAIVAWPAEGLVYTKPDNFFTGHTLKSILQERVMERLRTGEGKTYAPTVSAEFSSTFTYGYLMVSVEGPQNQMASVYETVDSIIADIAANGVTAEEFSRVMKQTLERIKLNMTQNGYWAQYLARAQTDPTVLPYFRANLTNYEKVTPADVQAAAKKWLRKDTAWRLMVIPEPPASGTGAGQR